MNQGTSSTQDLIGHPCPSRPITVELALANIEELDYLAELNHISRQDLLVQIINAGLLNDTPHLPAGDDPAGRLSEHAYLTHLRSIQIAVDQVEEGRS